MIEIDYERESIEFLRMIIIMIRLSLSKIEFKMKISNSQNVHFNIRNHQ